MVTPLRALLVSALALSCAPAPRPSTAYPAGPGLLDDRPPQPPNSYRLVGWVLADQTGRPLEGAQVIVEDANLATLTDKYGRYLLDGLPEGHDGILVRHIGFHPERRTLYRKRQGGLWVGIQKPPLVGTDTLNFWLHEQWIPLP